jgi:hypothetical protein
LCGEDGAGFGEDIAVDEIGGGGADEDGLVEIWTEEFRVDETHAACGGEEACLFQVIDAGLGA